MKKRTRTQATIAGSLPVCASNHHQLVRQYPTMFHAVNQISVDDEGDDLTSPSSRAPGGERDNPRLPMFREPSNLSSIIGGASPQQHDNNSSNHDRNGSLREPPLTATSGAAAGSGRGTPVRREHRLRSRRTNIEMTAMKASSFAGPDVVQLGDTTEPGTFRWDSAVADSSGEGLEGDGDGEVGEIAGEVMQPRGIGMPLRSRNKRAKMRFRPLPADVLDGAPHSRRPWYIIVPESRTHQIFDHLGE